MIRAAMALGALVAMSACTAQNDADTAAVEEERAVRTVQLPAALDYPEGIEIDSDGNIYISSAVDGTVMRISSEDGTGEVLSASNALLEADFNVFPRFLGAKLDDSNRLWIAGGRTGEVFVLNAASGQLIKRMSVNNEGSLLNDASITSDAVYITDTRQPILWRIALDGDEIGDPERWIDFTGSSLEHDQEGRNLNGIVADPSGQYLLGIQMDKGLLYRISVADKSVTPVDVGGETLANGDGLVLDEQTLYLVRQADTEIVTLDLAEDWTSAKVVSRFTHPALTWPATAALYGDELYVVDSQFNRRASNDPVRPFSLVVIPLERLAGN